MKSKISKDYCPLCNKEMRKWLESTSMCVSKCINKKCRENGTVYRAVQNTDSHNDN